MNLRSADLGDLWNELCLRYEERGYRVPPQPWRWFSGRVRLVLLWGIRRSAWGWQ